MNTRKRSSRTPADDMSARGDPVGRLCGGIAMFGVAMFTVVCLAVQFLRKDLDWITTPMSIYALGARGAWVQAAFFAPVPGLAALGFGWRRTFHGRVWNRVALGLFTAAAIALCFTGAFLADATPSPVTQHGTIHQWAAFGIFVFVTTGMILQSWRFRFHPHWRRHFPDAFAIAVIAFVYFWVYALFHPIPRGLGEKIVIGLVLLWVWRSAWWLASDVPPTGDDRPRMEPPRNF